MSVYGRRRLLAAALIALIAAGIVTAAVLVLSGGSETAANRPIGGSSVDGTQASEKVRPELAAHPRRTVPLPGKPVKGDGPIFGDARETGVVVMGTDCVAVDATCCRVMGFYLDLPKTG